jgi:protein disulfide-isomerase
MMFFRVALFAVVGGLLLPTSGLAASSAPLPPPWSVDLPSAQARAKAEGKFVLIHFSGSDWCGWCMKLKKDVFLKPEFVAYAQSNLTLVTIDFPKHKNVPSTLQATNQRVAEQFQVQGFPTLVLLDSQGKRVGNVNYAQGGAKVFVAELEKLIRPPPEPVAPKTVPTPPKNPTVRQGRSGDKGKAAETVAAATTEAPSALTLKRISGSKHRRLAIINGIALSQGSTATFALTSGSVQVRCLEIRDKSVVVTVNGRERELKLSGTSA